ncbi:conserved hypothetical protein [Uncinocarpus reesii 1704]|uniref:Histone-lysine N-methyltransferase n=1 Tax=Uncinocarpus reesii (strain UAMH 1704) TaxID=336963 RepID=C4JTW3_UNCRE|nr:uncharacterized protein UREG_05902 [Uncinocarpus reesii 1704]EEP81060.1 conserved hypothetical protein [Uncinocarpus reesii 1704]
MVIDLTGDSTSEGEDIYHEAIKTSFNNADLLLATFKHQPKSHKTQRKLQELRIVPIQNSSSSSEAESCVSFGSRKRRRDETDSPASSLPGHHGLSDFFLVHNTPKKVAGMYAKVKDVKRSTTKFNRGVRTFQPPQKSRRTPLDLQNLYAKKVASINGPPVHITFNDNSRIVDFNFEFISNYKMQEGVYPVDSNFHAGCDCIGAKCNLRSCSCLSQEEDSLERIIPYRVGDAGVIILRDEFMRRKSMIYECSLLCNCDWNCMNKVVERGRTVRLEIFQTRNRGFGLRSADFIQAGQYIDCYLGEVVTKVEADDREAATSNNRASYLFSLDFLVDQDDDDIYVVDGRKFGSVTRFMNHSCKPNCQMFPVSHNHADQHIFGLAFFAVTDIPPGKELTFDYHPNWKSDGNLDIDPDAVKCLCGEKNCRGQLWPNQRKTLHN